ncbi:SDR family NAD(P)-dependent oxidoreductase [Halosolutus halophilus]|uniref:SDR family NAD(P)-dependent oxidoreductase n=1 Tax=Halosolutus halophilus TaxID=1552990 RepID=UPI002234FE92|nr:SDR family NAD(P)-dependent oxidoreductase [Halosolutus halophilus]
MSDSLTGRTALITGAASGIGRGIATTLAEAGTDIVVADVRREPKRGKYYQSDLETPTDALVEEAHGVESLYVETDIGTESDVRELIDATVDRFGGLDILVNNAGIQILGETSDLTAEDWHRVMDVNITSCFLTAKYGMEHLRESESGRIINVSSINAYFGGGGAPYAASKAGMVNLTRDLAIEAARSDVTVNSILPGVIKTPMQDQNDEETQREQREATLLSRLGTPEDVGKAVRFLASDDAEWITGAELLVDGGYCAAGY